MNASLIAKEVRSGARSARSAVEECLTNIDAREADIHAFNLVMRDEALAAADKVDLAVARGENVGTLAGVPVALKDNFCTEGIPTTCSSRILEDWRPPYDATIVKRLREAGAIVIGKTNLDEFGMGGSTENSATGVTRNPYDLTRVPGGSSGGSAAAVAAGFAPLAIGSDTGGSVRTPAAYCGVVGIKPTYGLVSRYGLVAFASSLDVVGPMGATVEDAALCLSALAGYDPLDSTSINRAADDYTAVLNDGVDGLRVGVISEISTDGIPPDVSARVQAATRRLQANGAKVEEVSVPAVRYGISAYYLVAPAEASSNLARYDGIRHGLRVEGVDVFDTYAKTRAQGFGPEVKRRIMLGTYALSAGYYDAYYGKAQQVRSLMVQEFAEAFERFDVLISPTAPSTAFPIGELADDPLAMYLNDTCSVSANLAGLAAMSVPFGTGDNDMPVGVQLWAPSLGEQTMLRAASVLEKEAAS